jgi:hypothetical protein
MRKYVKNHGIIFGGPQNFVGFSTGPWTGKGWETLLYSNDSRPVVPVPFGVPEALSRSTINPHSCAYTVLFILEL